jgi:predicted dehydrogenase
MIHWGIIGVGDVCEKKSGPAFNKVAGSKLQGVMRRTGKLAEDYANRHGVPVWYDDAEVLINDTSINAIYIATPPSTHAYYTKLAAAAGKPVYVEKPMARNHEECLEMVAACKEAGVPLYVAFYRRALPNFLKVKALLEEGAIGKIIMIETKVHKYVSLGNHYVNIDHEGKNWRIDPEIAGAGYFYDLASHQLDFFDYLFGPIIKASGMAKNVHGEYSAEDTTLGTFLFENGVIGTGSWCFCIDKDSEVDNTIIYGTEGRIEFPFFTAFHVTLKKNDSPDEIMHFDIPENIQQPLIQTIVDDINEVGMCPSTGVSGARTNWVMAEICKRVD